MQTSCDRPQPPDGFVPTRLQWQGQGALHELEGLVQVVFVA